jgi:hypothetical protein
MPMACLVPGACGMPPAPLWAPGDGQRTTSTYMRFKTRRRDASRHAAQPHTRQHTRSDKTAAARTAAQAVNIVAHARSQCCRSTFLSLRRDTEQEECCHACASSAAARLKAAAAIGPLASAGGHVHGPPIRIATTDHTPLQMQPGPCKAARRARAPSPLSANSAHPWGLMRKQRPGSGLRRRPSRQALALSRSPSTMPQSQARRPSHKAQTVRNSTQALLEVVRSAAARLAALQVPGRCAAAALTNLDKP